MSSRGTDKNAFDNIAEHARHYAEQGATLGLAARRQQALTDLLADIQRRSAFNPLGDDVSAILLGPE